MPQQNVLGSVLFLIDINILHLCLYVGSECVSQEETAWQMLMLFSEILLISCPGLVTGSFVSRDLNVM